MNGKFHTHGPRTLKPVLACCALLAVQAGLAGAARAATISASAALVDYQDITKSKLPPEVKGTGTGAVAVDAWNGTAPYPYEAGAYAAARVSDPGGKPGPITLGTVALARSSGFQIGNASASVTISYRVDVVLDGSDDPLFYLTQAGCHGGCLLETTFVHDSHGQFVFDPGISTDARASVSDTLSIYGDTLFTINGSASVSGDPRHSPNPALSMQGYWQAKNFKPIGPMSGTAAGIFAPDDPRAKEAGDAVVKGYSFSQTDILPGQPKFFVATDTRIYSSYILTIEQISSADYGSSTFDYGSVAADFFHTANFGVQAVFDPTHTVDLSGMTMHVTFTPIAAPVPLPASWLLLLPGCGALLRKRRTVRRAALRPRAR